MAGNAGANPSADGDYLDAGVAAGRLHFGNIAGALAQQAFADGRQMGYFALRRVGFQRAGNLILRRLAVIAGHGDSAPDGNGVIAVGIGSAIIAAGIPLRFADHGAANQAVQRADFALNEGQIPLHGILLGVVVGAAAGAGDINLLRDGGLAYRAEVVQLRRQFGQLAAGHILWHGHSVTALILLLLLNHGTGAAMSWAPLPAANYRTGGAPCKANRPNFTSPHDSANRTGWVSISALPAWTIPKTRRRGAVVIRRMMGAAFFNAHTYEEIEADTGALGQAIGVVLLVTLCGAAGGLIGALLSNEPLLGIILVLVSGLAFGIVRWAIWVTALYIVGGKMLRTSNTETSWGEVGRVFGFAYTPGVLYFFAFVPSIGWLFVAVALFWTLAAAVLAVRQAMDFESTGRAIVVTLIAGVIGFIPWAISFFIQKMLFGGGETDAATRSLLALVGLV